MGIQRKQPFNAVRDNQQTIGMARQPQRSAASIGQHFGLFAVEARANQSAVMQAGDQHVVLQQQCYRSFDVSRADTLHAFKAFIVGVVAAGEGGRRRRVPGHRADFGREQQQKGAQGNQEQ